MRTKAPLTAIVYAAFLSCSSIDHDTAARKAVVPAIAHLETSVRLGAPPSARIVVVAIDGARAQEMFAGTDDELARASDLRPGERATADELVPHIRDLARRGVALGTSDDSSFEASGPNFVSLPGYTEMLTGRPAPCQENDCDARPASTLADEVRALPGVSRNEVAVISSWERIDRVAAGAPSTIVVSAGRNHGATRELLAEGRDAEALLRSGEKADAFPGHDDYRPDRETIAIASSYFEREKPRFLFVSLGDSDEHAHAGNYRGYLDALRRADAFVGDLDRIAKSWGPEGDDVVFFVTTDHGRSARFRDHGRDYPESARTWLVASGGPLARTGFVGPTVHGRLRDIAPTVREIMGIVADGDRASGVVLTDLFRAEGPKLALQ